MPWNLRTKRRAVRTRGRRCKESAHREQSFCLACGKVLENPGGGTGGTTRRYLTALNRTFSHGTTANNNTTIVVCVSLHRAQQPTSAVCVSLQALKQREQRWAFSMSLLKHLSGIFAAIRRATRVGRQEDRRPPVQTSGPIFLLLRPQLWAPTRHSGSSSSRAEICLPEAHQQPSHHQHTACPIPRKSTSYCPPTSQASQGHMTEIWHGPTVGHQELGASEVLPSRRHLL